MQPRRVDVPAQTPGTGREKHLSGSGRWGASNALVWGCRHGRSLELALEASQGTSRKRLKATKPGTGDSVPPELWGIREGMVDSSLPDSHTGRGRR